MKKFELRAYDCNCSICVKKGMLPVLVPKENFKLLEAYWYTQHSKNEKSLIKGLFSRREGYPSKRV